MCSPIGPRRCRAPLLSLIVALAGLAGLPSRGDSDEPFELQTASIPGRPLDVFAVPPTGTAQHVVAVGIAGTVPDERRTLAFFPAGRDAAGPLAEPSLFEVPSAVVGFDVADLLPGGGVEVALLSARELTITRPGANRPLRTRTFTPPLPLPTRTRGVSRLSFLRPWGGGDVLSALVPSLDGLRHVPIGEGPVVALPVPLETRYDVMDPTVGVRAGALDAYIAWPQVALADDNGDGFDDLFALTRYDVVVFHAGPAGLASTPSRQVSLRPFTPKEELRHLATSLSLYAHDLDGDGLADLVLHRTIGTLLNSRSETLIFRNSGGGADPSGVPDLTLADEGGFGAIFLRDVDGDGRSELLQTLVPFGVIQLMRVLVTERVQAKFRLLRFPGAGVAETETSWEEDLALPLDFSNGRISGVVPTLAGDLNGDGHRDLVWGESLDELSIRLGEPGAKGPRFGPRVARQKIPAGERALVADLDSDGLDDLVLYDTMDASGQLHVLRNRGKLPGSPSSLEPAPE
ncbi:MAG: VCBS repeat-containing protein [Myxococcales bacterium]|nr:VCBS repeat-containing protein [Myxococcales bacterium]